MKKVFLAVFIGIVILFSSLSANAITYNKFNIPGDFPGNFRIDFLGTEFLVVSNISGNFSNKSTIYFSVNNDLDCDGIYGITVNQAGFNFVNIEIPAFSWIFDVFAIGDGVGTFNSNTGDWILDIPVLFREKFTFDWYLDFFIPLHLTTQNVYIPDSFYTDKFGNPIVPAHWTTSAYQMIMNQNNPECGNLGLVAAGKVPTLKELENYNWGLVDNYYIGIAYNALYGGGNYVFANQMYEFHIKGNDPVSSVPEPSTALLLVTGVVLLFLKRR
ncbi:hypothetical protein CO115_03540 [Candidatus Falkowbacteria bacterium CG_4_9_14_3_um_filter_36_9]|uniref:PEP-CTERM protein-sorting domain-containing protein n=2 Tax=Candidatus Falkowiibacteriota TaxID=1752728 RepID=A0A1J4T5A0_9BACT|nr:MAG: hypothetical protein AUJ27_03200 [Candidatus Falkowbacteria bacterium CG1_02_37_44]PIV50501.1 MAG: hypothetical protein COS18_04940 [Candidatus Falkowbacteria bacterium CG02_land_8_20_14_3_00_36_14]PIX10865.1 MAG: hypothetical protein COZ73_04385 [Candidatus Falkowbacteria bacterium CG_4_8_14_3_um_filter_36_11]PJA10134.1 MAG: hypothetical protein COX67_05380 [Candidatus Falkowbacteria bacterium CG_4_10_14_0_2_um_filter_36_22]PJB18908.1 MAG: hypothetical protein CO115_03540 [Candidatus F